MQPAPLQKSLPSLWRILKYFWPHVRQYRLLIAGSLGALFAEVGLRLLEPWPLKFVFDNIIGATSKRGPAFFSGVKNFDAMTLLAVAAFAIIAITSVRAL